MVIVGGGAAGCLLAIQLLRPTGPAGPIVLVERGGAPGHGLAYGRAGPGHLLNVPCARLSADPSDPQHFLRWLEALPPAPDRPAPPQPGDFVARTLYGGYLQASLQAAAQRAPGRLEVIAAAAVDLEEIPGPAGRVTLADGRTLEARSVVLALGNLPAAPACGITPDPYPSSGYIADPWGADWVERVGPEDRVLLLGSGLTAADVVLTLDQRGHRGCITAISRRGWRPLSHRPGAEWSRFLDPDRPPPTVLAALRRFRIEVERAAAAGLPWQAVMDAARRDTLAVWSGWSWPERARFLRHARSLWDVHRHRVAPEVAAQLDRRVAGGTLKFIAGRIVRLESGAGAVTAWVRPRGTTGERPWSGKVAINCTGPATDYLSDPLLRRAAARGLVEADPLRLGLLADADGCLLRQGGAPVPWLHTLGSPLKGVRWETTAIPEIRQQAADLAARLLGR